MYVCVHVKHLCQLSQLFVGCWTVKAAAAAEQQRQRYMAQKKRKAAVAQKKAAKRRRLQAAELKLLDMDAASPHPLLPNVRLSASGHNRMHSHGLSKDPRCSCARVTCTCMRMQSESQSHDGC